MQFSEVRQSVWTGVRFRGSAILVGLLCTLLLTNGCAKKVLRKGVPFDLDKLFDLTGVVTKQSAKERGIRLAKEKHYEEAIQAFRQHVIEEPESYSGFNALAVCYKNLGDHNSAMKNYERALEFAEQPEERAKVLANIGSLYYSADKPQVALGYYKEANNEFEKNPLYLIYIARTFLVLNEEDRARRVLAAAEEREKDREKYEREDDRGLGAYLMAYCWLALKEEDKVFAYLERALKANPARYVSRIEKDLNDERSLMFSLKGDPRVEKALLMYATRTPNSVKRRSE